MTIEVYIRQSVDDLLAQQSNAIGLLQTDIENLQTRRWLIQTSNYQAQPGDRIVANGSSGGFTIPLPTGAAPGDEVQVLTIGTNAIVINPSGVNLNGATAPMTISTDRQETRFIFVGAAGWVATVGGGASSPTPTPTVSALAEIKKIPGWQLLLMSDIGIASTSVAAWSDQSGINNHAAQSTEALRPQLVSNSLPSQKPAVYFANAPQLVHTPIPGAEKTIFVVARFESGDAENYLLGHLPGNTVQLLGFDDDAAGMRILSGSGGYFGGLKRLDVIGLFKVFEVVIDSSRNATLFINGAEQPGTVTLGSDFSGGLVGAFGASFPRNLQGSIAAILVNGAMTSSDRASVRQQLMSWAGIS